MRSAFVSLAAALLVGPTAWAGAYSGEWEYQALNSGDTNFKVEHQGERITFYRVLFPEYEGKRFKLEHLYKGKLAGKTIAGEMWVREEGVAEFERLRQFDGSLLEPDRMRMDDMPLKRIRKEPVPVEPSGQPEKIGPPEPPESPKYTRVVIQDQARKQPADPDRTESRLAEAPAEPPDDDGPGSGGTKAAPLDIPELIPVQRRLSDEVRRRAQASLAEGDEAYARKRYTQAVGSYQAAWELDPLRVELLYKLGLGHGILGSQALRTGRREQAAGHYRQAIHFWEKAVRLDPYNAGAQENIRRARAKLAELG